MPLARILLVELSYFGNFSELSMNQCLKIAYKDFKAWCRKEKVHSSQPLFNDKKVPCS